MKVLLDVAVSPRLRRPLQGQLEGAVVETAVFREWRFLRDDRLLAEAARYGFTTLVTTDRRMAGEQRHPSIAIVADVWLHEPFYQVMRQRLLADRMVARQELGVSEAKVVLVVPDGNADYRRSQTSPGLHAAFPDAASVEEVTAAALTAPDRDFAVIGQHAIAEAVRARSGPVARDWSEYHFDRYGW